MAISWSHTALKDYENCPRKYYETRVLKKYPFEKSEQMRYGDELHKAAEQFVIANAPLPERFGFLQPTLDALMAKRGTKHAELKLAATVDFAPCDWFDKTAWVRGIVDLLILDGETAWVVDYKTGSNKYPDRDQLDLMALLTFVHYPQVKAVNAALIFVVKESMTKHKVSVDVRDKLQNQYRERVASIEASLANNVWNPKQSGLCPWCPVHSCEFHPEH
jgi:CRISPR/Cas system-associated exonuclease Cas4 (RecB family)